MFSVIIPLYNKAPYIEKAIYSILNQSFQEFEVIVVDDGSTDRSWDKLEEITYKLQVEYPEQYNKIVTLQQQNQGVSVARNNGVNQAKYDYITFLDADDWWSNSFLEKMKELIAQFPDGGIYGSSYYKVKNEINYQAKIGVDDGFEIGYFDYCKAYSKSLWMPLWTGAVVIKKSVFLSLQGFNNQLKYGEDFDLWMRIILKYPVVFLNTPLAFYNQDVEVQHRAVGKKTDLEKHFLFHVDYLAEEEKNNQYLKQLLDNLRVYSFKTHYLDNTYRAQIRTELNKVDWSNQPLKYKLYYAMPVAFLKLSSRLKVILLKFIDR
ncbi:MAG: glycosyltransferase family 2 protein [Paludibacteraceae bacterium]|nr:glycosyltransferase family 2 protein [Paludibacteraceae bacterium]